METVNTIFGPGSDNRDLHTAPWQLDGVTGGRPLEADFDLLTGSDLHNEPAPVSPQGLAPESLDNVAADIVASGENGRKADTDLERSRWRVMDELARTIRDELMYPAFDDCRPFQPSVEHGDAMLVVEVIAMKLVELGQSHEPAIGTYDMTAKELAAHFILEVGIDCPPVSSEQIEAAGATISSTLGRGAIQQAGIPEWAEENDELPPVF